MYFLLQHFRNIPSSHLFVKWILTTGFRCCYPEPSIIKFPVSFSLTGLSSHWWSRPDPTFHWGLHNGDMLHLFFGGVCIIKQLPLINYLVTLRYSSYRKGWINAWFVPFCLSVFRPWVSPLVSKGEHCVFVVLISLWLLKFTISGLSREAVLISITASVHFVIYSI